MKSWIHLLVAAALAGSMLTQSLHAALISGYIGFTGIVSFDYTSASAATATAVTAWYTPQALAVSGTFATPPYAITVAAPASFTPQTWNFNTTTPIADFWSVGGSTFELRSSQIVAQGARRESLVMWTSLEAEWSAETDSRLRHFLGALHRETPPLEWRHILGLFPPHAAL